MKDRTIQTLFWHQQQLTLDPRYYCHLEWISYLKIKSWTLVVLFYNYHEYHNIKSITGLFRFKVVRLLFDRLKNNWFRPANLETACSPNVKNVRIYSSTFWDGQNRSLWQPKTNLSCHDSNHRDLIPIDSSVKTLEVPFPSFGKHYLTPI